jgi:uncharacterized protein (TIGR03086 family)
MWEPIGWHQRALDGFGRAVSAAAGRWDAPTPCTDWPAEAVVDHVIGFHQVLLLNPLGLRLETSSDPAIRWDEARAGILAGLADGRLADGPLDIPARGTLGPSRLDIAQLLPALTTDVLVHTWDLSRAVGADDRLDEELCGEAYERAEAQESRLRTSGMFGPRVAVPDSASVQEKLLGLFGRDPDWSGHVA